MVQVSGLDLTQITRSRYVYNSKIIYFSVKKSSQAYVEDLIEYVAIYSGLDPVCYIENGLYILFFTKSYSYYISEFALVQLKDHFDRAYKMFDHLLMEYRGNITRIEIKN